ncbi:DEAD/DEAH box helicase family protein [Thiolapillus sp.]|uniref:DEAD/DEAH box helicase family protein n=1 Tax=Thiolapillus sp. TaxID=2017437 RepID=UPI003AF49579
MRTIENLRPYQQRSVDYLKGNPLAMLDMGMGMGKTIIALTSIQSRIEVGWGPAVIFGPKRVVEGVWTEEAKKWEHTKDLTFSEVLGTPKQKLKGLTAKADIYLCNYESMKWLVENWPKEVFDQVIYDEVTNMSSMTSVRMRAWKKVLPSIMFRTGMTGTPTRGTMKGLQGQYYAIDEGERLGRLKTVFDATYMTSHPVVWKRVFKPGAKQAIMDRIRDITLTMETADYRTLPDVIHNDVMVTLPKDLKAQYDKLEMHRVLRIGDDLNVFAGSDAVRDLRCAQMASGFIVTEDDTIHYVHNLKLDALHEIVKTEGPLLVLYDFVPNRERILQAFQAYNPVDLSDPRINITKFINDWNRGKVHMAVGHPQAIGFGLDGLQKNPKAHMVFYGLTDNGEAYMQTLARLVRPPRVAPVRIHRILARDTIDEKKMKRVDRKMGVEMQFKSAMKNPG